MLNAIMINAAMQEARDKKTSPGPVTPAGIPAVTPHKAAGLLARAAEIGRQVTALMTEALQTAEEHAASLDWLRARVQELDNERLALIDERGRLAAALTRARDQIESMRQANAAMDQALQQHTATPPATPSSCVHHLDCQAIDLRWGHGVAHHCQAKDCTAVSLRRSCRFHADCDATDARYGIGVEFHDPVKPF